jgi:DNA primase
MPMTVSQRSNWVSLVERLANPVPADIVGALSELHVEVIRETAKERRFEYLAHCPMHEARTGKEDRHPSFWVNGDSGAFICFSCDYQGSFTQLVADGLDVSYTDAKMWIVSRRGGGRVKPDREPRTPSYVVQDREYAAMAQPPAQALRERKLSSFAAELYGVRWKDGAWVLPIRSAAGDLMGWQEKKGHTFFNRPDTVKKSETLFGIGCFTAGSVAILTESPLCAVRIGSVGIPGAVASFGVQVSEAQMRLVQARTELLILALDNPFVDRAGRQMTEYLYRKWSTRGMRIKVFNYAGMDGKDPSDLSDAEVEFGIENACGLRSLKYVHR